MSTSTGTDIHAGLQTWKTFLRAHAAITRTLDAEANSEHGLTLSDYEVLLHLSNADGGRLRMSELADRVLLTRSGMTRLVKGLEDAGFVARVPCAEDARVCFAQLTDAGSERLAQARESHLRSVSRLFLDRFSEQELQTLSDLLGRLPLSWDDCAAGGRDSCS